MAINKKVPRIHDMKGFVLSLTAEKDKQVQELKKKTGLNNRQLFYFLTDYLSQNDFPQEVYEAFKEFDAKYNVRRAKKKQRGTQS